MKLSKILLIEMKNDIETIENKAEDYLNKKADRAYKEFVKKEPDWGIPSFAVERCRLAYHEGFIEGYIISIVLSIFENLEKQFPGISLKDAYPMF